MDYRKLKWDIYKAKAWMLKTGMDHIEGQLYFEGGCLIYEAKWGDGCDTEDLFREALSDICWWDEDTIDEAIAEIHASKNNGV